MRTDAYNDLVVIITGASTGIGRAAALAFAARGARLVLVARDESRLRDVVSACEKNSTRVPATENLKSQISNLKFSIQSGDVANPATMTDAVARAVELWGRADILINNAGIGHNLPFDQLSWEQIQRILETNLHGVFHGIRAALPVMKQQ